MKQSLLPEHSRVYDIAEHGVEEPTVHPILLRHTAVAQSEVLAPVVDGGSPVRRERSAAIAHRQEIPGRTAIAHLIVPGR